jgi:putative transposase
LWILANITIVNIAQSYRFRIYPTKAQEGAFRQISGCCRPVYNLGLEQRRDHWRRHKAIAGNSITWISQKRELVRLMAEFSFMKDVPSHCLQQALRDLDRVCQVKIIFLRLVERFQFPVMTQSRLMQGECSD